jgi:hypothetical protein
MWTRRRPMPSDIEATRAEREKDARRPLFGRKISKGDAIMAAIGISLAVVSAVFPWYIFYNPEQFGIKAMKFEGNQSGTSPTTISYQPSRIGQPMSVNDIPSLELDLFATATLPGRGEDGEALDLAEQPFPPDTIEYQLIHVANGRAMIQDKDGIWVVQPGSLLPDSSRVARIEQRDGSWVIVTTLDRVIELTN